MQKHRRPPARHRNFKQKNPSKGLWLYGKHACFAALSNKNRHYEYVLVTAAILSQHPELKQKPRLRIVENQEIAAQLPEHAVHQGIAIKAHPLASLAVEEVLERSPLLILDHVTDPQNIGAILRSAAAFEAGAVIVTRDNAPEESGAMAKAACGALEQVPLVQVTNLSRCLEELKDAGFWCIGLAGEATETLEKAISGHKGKLALVLGAEGKGLRRLTGKRCDNLAKLPISPQMESLNVSNAAAIALYELHRQK